MSMFCYQCQETAGNTACKVSGVCGKKDVTSNLMDLLVYLLQGISLLGEKALKTLRLSQESRSSVLQDFQKLPRQNTSAHREWENWLKGGNPHLLMTFESECASQHPEAVFIMPLHPLVKQAAMAFDTRKRIFTALKVNSNEVPKGRYEFAIYQWQFHGIKEDLVLRPVASSVEVTKHLSALLEISERNPFGDQEY